MLAEFNITMVCLAVRIDINFIERAVNYSVT